MTFRPALPADARALRDPGLHCFVAWDPTTVRHLGVHPDQWGRGLTRAAIGRAVTSIRGHGHEPTGRDRRAEWPPYPVEQEHGLRGSRRA